MDEIIRKINDKGKDKNLLEFLSEELSLSELNSLMLHVFSRRTTGIKSADVLKDYLSNRFTRASKVDPQKFIAFDRLCYSLLPEGFRAIELSPLAPLGSCSSMAPVHQNNVVSTIRNSEVLADATNVLALECAAGRKEILQRKPKSNKGVKLACSHRLVRAQQFEHKEHTTSFRTFSLCSAGRDEGNFEFEIRNLSEQIQFYLILIEELGKSASIKKCQLKVVELDNQNNDSIFTEIRQIISHFKHIELHIEKAEKIPQSYYEHLRFMIDIESSNGVKMNYIDGGFTNWTKNLLGSRKERLLISGIGSELILKILEPTLPH